MRRWQTVLPLAASALIIEPFVSDRLNAQTTETELGVLVDRIGAAEHDLKSIERHIYSGGNVQLAAATGITGASEDQITDQASYRLIERIDGLEREVRDLTGQVEELGNRLDQLQQQFNQFSGKAEGPGTQGNAAPRTGMAPTASSASGPEGTPLSGNSAQGPGAAPGETTLGQVPADTVPDEGTIEDQYDTALGYLRQQDYANAEAALKSFLARHGETELAGAAMFWLGETYFVQSDFTNAAQTFLDSLKKYPDSQKAPDSMLKLGMSLAAIGQKDQACVTLRQLPKKYPNASQTIVQRAKVESQRASCPAK